MKKLICMAMMVVTVCLSLARCQKTDSDSSPTPVILNGVAHSTFYVPQYATIELGYLKGEDIDLTLVNGVGADKVMTALVSGDADTGSIDSEASIYAYMSGVEDYAANFAQLTQQAGNSLVGRQSEKNFQWSSLAGKEALGGRVSDMPQMAFEYILKKNGPNPKTDLTINQSIDFGLTVAVFTSDDTDYIVEFEPLATGLEVEGSGHVVVFLGEESGYVSYTAYCVEKSYMEKNPELIQKFTNAIQKGIDHVNSYSAEETAKAIQPQFKETDSEKITLIVDRYKQQDIWKDNTVFEKESFELLQNILEEAGELKIHVLYENLVAAEFVKTVAK